MIGAGELDFGWPGAAAATPVGRLCLWCDDPIGERDRGYLERACFDPGGWRLQPIHFACRLRMILGSVGHIEGRCSCYVTPGEEDPPGLTRREAAIAAVAAYEREYGVRLMPD